MNILYTYLCLICAVLSGIARCEPDSLFAEEIDPGGVHRKNFSGNSGYYHNLRDDVLLMAFVYEAAGERTSCIILITKYL